MNQHAPASEEDSSAVFESSNRKTCPDKRFPTGGKISEASFQNFLFQRLVAKEVAFEKVNFSYTIFDTCYLRKCVFQDCDFTGCRFAASNFHGSSFIGCTFDYAVFERTIIDAEILDLGFPAHENLKLKFARSLRTNFQSLGDAASVNKAIKLELAATQEHLFKSWNSRESYYRRKYRGWARFRMFLSWFGFKILDFIWGNGESLWKLGRAVLILLALMAIADLQLQARDPLVLPSYIAALLEVPSIFFGLSSPTGYPGIYLTAILVVRLVVVAFFLSIIIKRFSRR